MNIFKNTTYKYSKPFNFDLNNKFFSIFKEEIEYSDKPKIIKIENARIANNSVVFKGSKIFPESCIGEDIFNKYQNSFWRLRLKFIFPHLNFSRKKFILITDEWTSNYYHWHVFALGRLTALKDAGLIENSILILPKKYQTYSMVKRSLAEFGIKENQIIFLRRKSNIKVRELYLVSSPQHHPDVLRKVYEKIQGGKKNQGEKIYISREKARARSVDNEKEVVKVLNSFGFKKIIAENLSYEDQKEIMSKAKYLVSPHGAGLTNMMFMEKGSYVLELATISKTIKPVTDFYKMADILGINYVYQECQMGEAARNKENADPHEENIAVDLEWLEKNLKLMLSSD